MGEMEQIYKKNQKKIKAIKIATPIIRWGLLFLSILFLILALKNSFGNMTEIIELLDSKKYTGEVLKQNYEMLINKYGKWNIGNGSAGFSIEFINIGNALFSGIAITCFVLSVFCLIASFVFGKWLLPIISNQIEENNQNSVNLTVLKMAEKEKEHE